MSNGGVNKSENHLNINEEASTSIGIDIGIYDPPGDMVIIVYALFETDHLRQVTAMEWKL